MLRVGKMLALVLAGMLSVGLVTACDPSELARPVNNSTGTLDSKQPGKLDSKTGEDPGPGIVKGDNPPLPKDKAGTLIGMHVGSKGFTTPLALWRDQSGQHWLHPNYTVRSERSKASTMRVERRVDGYHVWPVPGQPRVSVNDPGGRGPGGKHYLKVVKLHFED